MEVDITKYDADFKASDAFGDREVVLTSCRKPPFSVHGLFHDGEHFRRLPKDFAESMGEGIAWFSKNSAGGRIRFRTDSPFVAIHLVGLYLYRGKHFAPTGSAGVDLYADGVFVKTYFPPLAGTSYTGIIELGEKKMRDILLELPLYSVVADVEIGLAPDAIAQAPKPYRYPTPAVFYGSSVTQGGCATRPGTCYQAFLSRHFDLDYVNLGFSGSARGEVEMGEYIADLPMSVFFLDFDYTHKTPAEFRDTHERFFLQIREKHPDLPIIIMSRAKPKAALSAEEIERLCIIKTTYANALARGDKNVYFLDGNTLMALAGTDGTVDGSHPTDLGFFSISRALIDLIEREGILK